MQDSDLKPAVANLLAVAMVVSPTSTEQGAFGTLVNRMESAGELNCDIIVALADAISDGIRLGNWPKAEG